MKKNDMSAADDANIEYWSTRAERLNNERLLAQWEAAKIKVAETNRELNERWMAEVAMSREKLTWKKRICRWLCRLCR